jgi:hypothetical protein
MTAPEDADGGGGAGAAAADFLFLAAPFCAAAPLLFALERAKRKPHALHNSFFPLGPLRHSGLEVVLQ